MDKIILYSPEKGIIPEIPEGAEVIKPGPGVQENFCRCEADGAIYGGEAGSGKTTILQIISCQYYAHPTYTGQIFRRVTTSIRAPGAMWETGVPIYRRLGARCTSNDMSVNFRAGGLLKYSHLENENDVYAHHGGQYAFIGFDEITEFTKKQFLYLITRNRPLGGSNLIPFWRATCNADAESWVRELLDWWIGPDGYPIKERNGILRYYTIRDDDIVWVDKDWRDDVTGTGPQSFTFYSASLDDNPVSKAWKDSYRGKLQGQSEVVRERLMRGNWNITTSGHVFNPKEFIIEEEKDIPKGIKWWRYYDMAATEKKDAAKADEPASTASALVGMFGAHLWVKDMTEWMEKPGVVEDNMKRTAEVDGYDVAISWEEEKGSAGRYVSHHLQNDVFKGYETHPDPVSGGKVSRADTVAGLAHSGCLHLVRGEWNRRLIAQAGVFYTPGRKCDLIDALSGGHKVCTGKKRIWPKYQQRNFKPFEPIKWADLQPETVIVIISLWGDKANGIYGICTCWGRKTRKLYVYSEIVKPNVVIDDLVVSLRISAQIPLGPGGQGVRVSKIYVNDELSGGGEDVRRLLRKQGISTWANARYDDVGGVAGINTMFASDMIVVHDKCVESDRQFRGWCIEDKSGIGRPQNGFPLCRALCTVVGDLKEHKEIDPPAPLPAYSAQKMALRDKVRRGRWRHGGVF